MPDQSLTILCVAAIVFVLLQCMKRLLPGICGRHAVALNVIFTSVATVIAARPGSWADAIQLILGGSLAAAGLHGTARSFRAPNAPSPDPAAVPALVLVLLLGTLGTVGLTGCTHHALAGTPATAPTLAQGAVDSTDATANEVLQTAQAFAAHLSADHQSGQLDLTRGQLMALEDLNRAINAAAPVEKTYHLCGQMHPSSVSTTCGAAALLAAISSAEKAFSNAELALAPTATK